MSDGPRASAGRFCDRFGLEIPILLAPMAGVPAPLLSAAVAEAGGLGACGALLMTPDAIAAWADDQRRRNGGAFQLNLWIPDPPPHRDAAHEARLRAFLGTWGPPVPETAGDAVPPDFDAQCDALVAARPRAVSSIMGLFPPRVVARLKAAGIPWFATATTRAEAVAAVAAGADVVVAQGAEAGGHRGAFDAAGAERDQVGLFALLPAIVDAVPVPVIATGGIADGRGVAAALVLGASAVQVGTGFLRCPEAAIAPAWAAALEDLAPEGTALTRAFSGRAGRSVATRYVHAAAEPSAPTPAAYPVQRALTAGMRAQAQARDDLAALQAWAGQAGRLARAEPARDLARRLWTEADALMG